MTQEQSKIPTPVLASIKFEVRSVLESAKRFARSLQCWKNQSFVFDLEGSHKRKVEYSGAEQYLPAVKALFASRANEDGLISVSLGEGADVVIKDSPMLGALKVPLCLATMVELNRSMDDIMATYSRSLRRSIQQLYPEYRLQKVTQAQQVDELDDNMLRPYITARHDVGAAHLSKETVHSMALKNYGQLDVLMQGDEAVGCHLGNSYVCRGKSYWHVNRLGYPEKIYSDYKRWGDVNSINLHLALEHSIKAGYDYCDYGVSFAKPGAGLLEWKRRRKGFLSVIGNPRYFYLKLPKVAQASLLWDSPVFSVQGSKIHLHLGIPLTKTEEEIGARYHEMGYAGLSKVYLHCEQPPSAHTLKKFEEIFADSKTPPQMVVLRV